MLSNVLATPLFEYCSIIRSSNRTPINIPLDLNKAFGSGLGVYTRIRINRYQSAPLRILLDGMAIVTTRVREPKTVRNPADQCKRRPYRDYFW